MLRPQPWLRGAALAVLACPAGAGCRPAPPRAELTSQALELGQVPAGEKKPFRIKLRNAGGQPLRIERIDTDCGCLTVRHPATIPPGATAAVEGTFEPQPQWGGAMEKSLRVFTNDPSRPEIPLAVRVQVQPYVAHKPGNPVAIRLRRGETRKLEVELRPRSGIRLQAPDSNQPFVHPTLRKPAASGAPYRLTVVVGPRQEPGDWSAIVRVPTTEPRLPDVWITLDGEAADGPVARPREVAIPSLRAAKAGQEIGDFEVFSRAGGLRGVRVEASGTGVRGNLRELEPGRRYQVTVTTTKDLPSGPLAEEILVRTADSSTPLRVPVNATVQ